MKVTIEPKGIVVETDGTHSVMAAAEAAGYQWPTICHGKASCKACLLELVGPLDGLAPMGRLEATELERAMPARLRAGEPIRLACQAVPIADVVVRKRGVRPTHL